MSVGILVVRGVGGIGRLISCLGAEIFLLADTAIMETRKLVSDEQKSGITASNDGIKNERSHCFLLQSFVWQLPEERRGNLLRWERRRCI